MKLGRSIRTGMLTTAFAMSAIQAHAAEPVFDLDISVTNAVEALNFMAQQTDYPLFFDYDAVKALQVNPVKGSYSLREALDLMFQDTGFYGHLFNREVITISPQQKPDTQPKDDEMNFQRTKKKLMTSASLVLAVAASTPVNAQAQTDDTVYEDEIISVGTRSSKPRTAADSPVAVDSLSGDLFNSTGNAADVTDNLKSLVPSYTATPATGDGSAFVRPTSLRGLAPDQTLVLVNGKRRHRSSLIHFFAPAAGNGAHGPDIAMIPSIALKRVEVLRDGAAAQYGSDAIAGVINFVTKDAPEGGEVVAQFGQFYEGENSYKIGANIGAALGDNGFVNVSGEWIKNDALSRGHQRPDGQALVDAGNQGVGADSPFGDEPFVQTWGRPETSGVRLFLNAGYDIGSDAELYATGNFADTDGRFRFFYRNPSHSSLTSLVDNFGYSGPLLNTGFTPYLDGAQRDISLTTGLRGLHSTGWNYDFSLSTGSNELDYLLHNSVNQTLGLGGDGEPAQRDFDLGSLKQSETNINADFSKEIRDNLNLGLGFEWREEKYTVSGGEEASYIGSGSSGFRGFTPENSGVNKRDNVAVYADIEHDVSDALLLQYAVRYEDFSDFGDTLNWKVAGRLRLADRVAIRGAASTGFHAPTPGQSNITSQITTFDAAGNQTVEGQIRPTDPVAVSVGGKPLTEEKSQNFSVGGTFGFLDNANLTVDLYQIDVEDRIYRTGNIAAPTSTGTTTVSFFTNALDVRHKGVDVVLTNKFESLLDTDVSLALNYNEINVTGQSLVNGLVPVGDSIVEDIENNYPKWRGVVTTNSKLSEKLNLMLRGNYYGTHYDERGTINAATSPSAKIGSTIYIDAELGYDVTDDIQVAVGATNILDEYVDEIDAPFANRQNVGLPYPRRSAANYEGGSWYVRAQYKF